MNPRAGAKFDPTAGGAKEKNTQTDRPAERERERERETERETERQRQRQRQRETNRQTDRPETGWEGIGNK